MINKNNLGFTMLEMVFVIVLIGILGVVVMPSVNLVRKQEVKKMAKEMCLDFSAQRIRAMTATSTGYFINLVEVGASGEYYSYSVTPADIMVSKERNTNTDNTSKIRITMTSGSGLSATTLSSIQFDKSGYMMDSAKKDIQQLVIKITSDDEHLEIDFNGVTGNYIIKNE